MTPPDHRARVSRGRRLLMTVAGLLLICTGLVAPAAAAGPEHAPAASYVRAKLAEASGLGWDHGKLSGQPDRLAAVTRALSEAGVTRVQPVFSQDRTAADRDGAGLERRAGAELPRLSQWVRLTAPAGRAAAVADRLRQLPFVQAAYAEVEAAPSPTTPDLTRLQVYTGPGPAGIATSRVTDVPGANGRNVTVADLEYAWNPAHEDLAKLRAPGALIANYTPENPFATNDHGTAAVGVLVGDANGLGITGLVPAARLRVVNTNTQELGFNPANAVDLARQNLSPGDVMLLELQTFGVPGADNYVPVEYRQDVYDAIRLATAAGIIVVEAAGNGAQDLDSPDYAPEFGAAGRPDSGAIIVGAGSSSDPATECADSSPARSRLDYSTYGSRVDVQGWGSCVVTAGYGDADPTAGPDAAYTRVFNGTSSASAVVAGAAAAFSSAYEERFGTPPTPQLVRDTLKASGAPQAAGLAGQIGPLPDLAAAFLAAGLGPIAPDVPREVTATAVGVPAGSALVSWSAPASDGGTPVTSYEVSASPAGARLTVPATARSVTLPGLIPGQVQHLSVVAVNGVGPGPAAVSGEITPRAIREDFAVSPGGLTKVAGGTWAAAGGGYVLSAPAAGSAPNNNLAVHGTTLAGDFDLSVSAAAAATTGAQDDVSVVYGYRDPANYSFAGFAESNSATGSGLFKVSGGVLTQLADIPSATSAGTGHTLRVVRTGTTVRAYRDGALVAQATDSSFTAGRVGVGTKDNGATFDNLVVTGAVGGPDLVVTSVTASPTAPAPGQTVRFSATITNRGTVPTPAGVVHGVLFAVNGTPVTFSGNTSTSLAPGASRTVTASGTSRGYTDAPVGLWKATGGTVTVTATVDDVNRMVESDETNNAFSRTLLISAAPAPTPAPGRPDLVVTSVTASPAAPTKGQLVRFTVVIKNQGTAATPAGVILGVGFRIDGSPVSYTDTSTAPLAPGTSRTLSATGGGTAGQWVSTTGTHALLAWVDDINRLPESVETNNKLTRTFVVR